MKLCQHDSASPSDTIEKKQTSLSCFGTVLTHCCCACTDVHTLCLLLSLQSSFLILLRGEQCIMQLVHVSKIMTVIPVVHCMVQSVISSPHDRGNPAVTHAQTVLISKHNPIHFSKGFSTNFQTLVQPLHQHADFWTVGAWGGGGGGAATCKVTIG